MKILERIVARLSAPHETDIWLDISQDPAVMKYYDGGEWKPIAGGGGSAPTDVLKYTEQSLTDEQKAQARENIGAAESGNSGGDPRLYKGGLLLDLTGGVDNPNIELKDGFTVDDIEDYDGFPNAYQIFKLKDSLLPFFNGEQCYCPEVAFDSGGYYVDNYNIVPRRAVMPLSDFRKSSESCSYKYFDGNESYSLYVYSDGTLDPNYEGD